MEQYAEKDVTGGINNRALRLTALLLIAFAVAFFIYYSLDTINNSVFGIDFSPYHVAGQLAAARDWGPLTDYAASGFRGKNKISRIGKYAPQKL